MHSFQQNARPHAQQAPPPHASQQTNSKASSMNNPNIHHNHQQQKSQQNQTFTSKFNSNMVYSTAHAQWTPQEFHLLQKALIDFPSTKYDNVTRYIKIAAAIPGKRVRDVAFKVKSMISSTTDCMAGNDHNIVVSQEPAPKRTKTEAHGARFTKLSTNNLPLPSNQQEQSPKNPVNINTLLQVSVSILLHLLVRMTLIDMEYFFL
jgi:hypothetical protein